MAGTVPYFKHANANWQLWEHDNGTIPNGDAALAVAMDIRGELRRIRKLLECPNALAIPGLLRNISANTRKPKRRKARRKK